MKYQVITSNQIIGAHYWKDAPERYKYLSHPHRHVFHIRCWFNVTETDREIELIDKQDEIERYTKMFFGVNTAGMGVEFGGMSCEDIAQWCIETFGCAACEVLEDGYGGAYVRK